MLIFLDVETTGLEANDLLCSIALLYDNKYLYELVNEGKKILAEASSINHITNEMLQGKSSFKESEAHRVLQKYNSPEHTLVAHNIKFDLEKLALSGLHWKGGIIDTLKVTKHLVPECELFALQVLRYELKLYKEEEVEKSHYGIKDALVAHNALSDAVVTKQLYSYLEGLSSEEEMGELSFQNVLLEKFTFGKYKGRYIEEICLNDRNYVQWLLTSKIDEDMSYSINYYLEGC